ncbi:MAG: hypothetical protein KC910_15845 [Candidatus Eremiobacteraeota bacterium]|nr:hypothetical protein [Candidatus Eremiobacteraeota bacterium]
MKNITVSVPEEVYRRARVLAAQKNTSVSALVREFLTGLSAEESDFERKLRLQEELIESLPQFSAGCRLTRDSLYERT